MYSMRGRKLPAWSQQVRGLHPLGMPPQACHIMDANMPAGRCPSLSQDLELTRLGGISPAERVFMYLQVPILSA